MSQLKETVAPSARIRPLPAAPATVEGTGMCQGISVGAVAAALAGKRRMRRMRRRKRRSMGREGEIATSQA